MSTIFDGSSIHCCTDVSTFLFTKRATFSSNCTTVLRMRRLVQVKLVSWRFGPNQTTKDLKPQLRFYPLFRKANPEKQQHMFWSPFIFRGHATREPASSRVTYFILRAYTGTGVSHSQHRENSGEILKMQANGLEGSKLARKKSLAVSIECVAIY